MAGPFLKWAGGKRQLLPEIEERLPCDIEGCTTYVEPFVGAGAVFFYLQEKYDFETIHISDNNPELVQCYRALQSSVKMVIGELQQLIDSYPTDQDERKIVYYEIRTNWNSRVGQIRSMSKAEKAHRAAQTIFLNKTCFNGLFRVNRKGEFNVPIGGYVHPSFPSPDSLIQVHHALKNVKIHHGSFEACESWVDDKTFVYFDPPYRPLSESSSFVSYSVGDFNDDNQRKLAQVFRELDAKGARLLLSNSDPKNTVPDDDFFEDLFAGFNIDRVFANRAINSNPKKRGAITELLISNS